MTTVEPPVLLKSSPSGWRDRLIRYDCSTREELRMNRKFRMTMVARIVIPAFGMAMAGHAFAADAAMSTGQAKAMSNAPATNSPPADARQANHAFRDMRATKLIGSDVRNAQNENLGEIKDLVIDVNNAQVQYAVLSFGGFLGLGDKLFAYPIKAFSPSGDGDKLILNVDRSKLKAAPGFDAKKWPEWNGPMYRADVDRYFGPSMVGKRTSNEMLQRATDLIGKDVNDRNGKDIGEIEDLVVNLGNGRVHYAVLEFDKSWSLNDKLLAVPLTAFSHRTGYNDLVMNVDKSKLDTKFAFDKNRWPDINDPKWIADVDRYLVLIVPTAATGNAMNGETAGMHADDTFGKLDTNDDGKLSNAEASKDAKVKAAWKQLDRNGDGSISHAEFTSNETAMKR